MKRTMMTIALLIAVAIVYGQYQEPYMNFSKLTHDFGKLQEGTSASVKFEFTNTGGKPLIIQNVKTSCGCTTPNWSKEPVAPGKKGFITVVYNTKGRPGSFKKTVTIISNAKNSPVVLTITGNVEMPQNPQNQTYRYTIGELKLKKNFVNFGNIYNNEKKTQEIEIFNPTDHDLNIVIDSRYKPYYLDVKVEPQVLKADQKGKIIITYDATKAKDWDYVRGFIYLTINGKRDYKNRIQVAAVIKEFFTEEQKKNPPRIEFEETVYKFDTINEGDVITHEFKFKNTGTRDLIIRKTKSSCGCTAVAVNKDPIPPGGTGVIKATFNSNHKRNRQIKTITVITNCPEPQYNKVLLRIEGYVIPKPKDNQQHPTPKPKK